MRIEEALAVQILARLADEMDLVEHDVGGIADMPEARRNRDDHQRPDDDGIEREPRGQRSVFVKFGLEGDAWRAFGGRKAPDQFHQRVFRSHHATQHREAVADRQCERGEIQGRSQHRGAVVLIEKNPRALSSSVYLMYARLKRHVSVRIATTTIISVLSNASGITNTSAG